MRHVFAIIAFFPLACSSSSSPPAGDTGGAGGGSGAGGASDGGAAGTSGGASGAGGVGFPFDGLNGCAESSYLDGTMDPLDLVVIFGDPASAYGPKCLTVNVGDKVKFLGDFSIYPIAPGSSPDMPDTGSPGNPIPPTDTGKSQVFAFPDKGTFPYYCATHYGEGMIGVIRAK